MVALLSMFAWIVFPCLVQAGQIADIKATLMTTRQHTMAMLSEDDRTVLEMRYDEALKSSKDLDALLASAVNDESLHAIQLTLLQFKAIWEEFKTTRDKEVVPALFAGERDNARCLAKNVQAGRFTRMNELLESLPQ